MQINLYNFFKYFDENNPKHVAAVEQFEKVLEKKVPEEITDHSEWVKTFRTKQEEPIVLKVPFYPQTDNYKQPQRTCNSSACAMCLEYFKPNTLNGEKGDDEYIRRVFALGDTTDHNVQTKVLEQYGIDSEFKYNLSFDDLDNQLESQRPVVIGILHRGSLSSPSGGHMLVVIGKTLTGDYIVNDPYGSINDGYTGPVKNGKSAVYKKSMLEKRWTPEGSKSGWGRIFNTKK